MTREEFRALQQGSQIRVDGHSRLLVVAVHYAGYPEYRRKLSVLSEDGFSVTLGEEDAEVMS